MNHVFNYATSVPQYFASAFTANLFPQLSTKQKQILTISSIAIGIFTAIIVAYRYFTRNPPSSGGGYVPHHSPPPFPKKYSPKKNTNSPPSSSSSSSSSSSPSSPRIPFVKPSTSIKLVNVSPKQPSPPVVRPINNSYQYQSPALKSPLSVVENEIKLLQEELAIQWQILRINDSTPLKVKGSNLSSDTQDDSGLGLNRDNQDLMDDTSQIAMLAAEFEISKLEDQLKNVLRNYPKMVYRYLKDKFSAYSQEDAQEIYLHLALLSGTMQNNAGNHDFIHDSLRQIETFLTETFFTSTKGLCLQETKKVDLAVFHEFFSIANHHLPVIKTIDPQLTINLKVKLANLPLIDEIKIEKDVKDNSIKDHRGNPIIIHPVTQLPTIDKITDRKQKFPNVHLTEQEQLELLVNHLQSEEDKNLSTIITNLYKRFSTKDVKKLARLASNKQNLLSSTNKLKLQSALAKRMGGQAPANWNDFETVQNDLNRFFNQNNIYVGYHYGYAQEDDNILNLHRASKAKQYFVKQMGWPDDKIQIPRWYHATDHQVSVAPIIHSGQVNVLHEKAFEGAWVSSQRETMFGNSVFVFNHRIVKLDPNVFIGYEQITERWRGMQCPIPLLDSSNTPYLSLMGVYQRASKNEKKIVAQALQDKGVANAVVVSVDQVDYLQKAVIKVIGSPDLPERWWGKADFSHLEKPPT
jgi:hypothetical protein